MGEHNCWPWPQPHLEAEAARGKRRIRGLSMGYMRNHTFELPGRRAPIAAEGVCAELSARSPGVWRHPNSGVWLAPRASAEALLERMRALVERGHFEDQGILGLALLQDARRSIFVDANATLFSSQYAYDAKLWARPACFADYFDERAAPPALLATGRTPFAMHFNGPAGRYRLGWCAATLLRAAAEDEGAAGAYFVDLDAGGRRVPVARLCGGALASTATIGAAKGRSVTPTVPCDAPGQRRVECTNDHCKWA
jgi:hypothetical protein